MKILKFIFVIFALSLVVFFIHFNNTKGVNPIVDSYYSNLKESLKKKGYTNNLLVISTKRSKWENKLFENFSVAAHDSRHLSGDAIDIIVGDINSDGKINGKDVDIVYKILDTEIVMDKGGIGLYKNQGFISRQMIHLDCRGERVRWNN
jgi:uncharacterized protein YcbK (DUF882 family)